MTNYIKIKLSDIKKYNKAEALILSLIRSFNAKNKSFEMKQDTIKELILEEKIKYWIDTKGYAIDKIMGKRDIRQLTFVANQRKEI